MITLITGATETISKSLIEVQYQESMKSRNNKKQHIVPCTHTLESTNIKVQAYFTCEITLHVTQIVSTIKKQQQQQ